MFIFKSDKYIIPIEEIDFWENGIFDKDTKDQKKNKLAMNMINNAIDNVENNRVKKINAIWLETSGCFGEVISLLNSEDPNLIYMLEKFVDMKYFGSIQGDQGCISIQIPANVLKGFKVLYNDQREEEFDLQGDTHRMIYEFKEFVKMIENKDFDKANEMMGKSLIAMDIATKARMSAGVHFKADESYE